MRTRHLATLIFGMILCSAASAKRVNERYHLYSIEVPDHWKFAPPDWSGAGGGYYNADRSVSVSLKSYDIEGMTLEQWAHSVASGFAPPGPTPKLFKDKLNKVPARRMVWGVVSRCYIVTWMAASGNQGAGICLSYPVGTKENIKGISKKLTTSFRWIK